MVYHHQHQQQYHAHNGGSPFLASGWVEQWRRSKMTKIWKPVRLSLTAGKEPVLWIERDKYGGAAAAMGGGSGGGPLETLHSIPLHTVRSIRLVDDYMGERRFYIMVPSDGQLLEDPQMMFRCADAESAQYWIQTLQRAQRGQASDATANTQQQPARRRVEAPPPAPPPPPPKAQPDLLSFHVVAPAAPPPTMQPPVAPPRPLTAKDFDPIMQQQHRPPHVGATTTTTATRPYAAASYPASTTTPTYVAPARPVQAPQSAGSPLAHHNNQTAIRHAVMTTWALQPPHFRHYRSLDALVTTVHSTFGAVAVHAYFGNWTAVRYADLCTAHVLDARQVERAVRKLKAFLYPDRLPADLNADQRFLCRLLWDTLDAVVHQQQHPTQQQ